MSSDIDKTIIPGGWLTDADGQRYRSPRRAQGRKDAKSMKYRSLDLHRGLSLGWPNIDLNAGEMRVLLFIAQWGRHNEFGEAFVYHPQQGIDAWARKMGLTEKSLYRHLARLEGHGLIRKVAPDANWSRRGYGIPDSVMAECKAHVQMAHGTDRERFAARRANWSSWTP